MHLDLTAHSIASSAKTVSAWQSSAAATNNRFRTSMCARQNVNIYSSAVMADKADRLSDRRRWRHDDRFFTAQRGKPPARRRFDCYNSLLSDCGPDWTPATVSYWFYSTGVYRCVINATTTSYCSPTLYTCYRDITLVFNRFSTKSSLFILFYHFIFLSVFVVNVLIVQALRS